jgi:hypothetical protein
MKTFMGTTTRFFQPVKPLFLTATLTLAAALVFVGCNHCKPGKAGPIGKYNIEVTLDDSLKNASVFVDLVGVNPSTLSRMEGTSMTKYWQDGSDARRDADKFTINFVSGKSAKGALPITDSKWASWKAKGVTHVFVLADLPGRHDDKPGTQDSRRQILALDQCNWDDKTTTLSALIQRSGIVVSTPPRSVK